jgi:hypothetical protein
MYYGSTPTREPRGPGTLLHDTRQSPTGCKPPRDPRQQQPTRQLGRAAPAQLAERSPCARRAAGAALISSLSRRLLPRNQQPIATRWDLSAGSVCARAAELQRATALLRARRAQILFQHLHKAGGTTICHLATL